MYKYKDSKQSVLRSLVIYAVQDRVGFLNAMIDTKDREIIQQTRDELEEILKFDLNNGIGCYTKSEHR